MRYCPFCAQRTADDADRCVHCGHRLPPRAAEQPPPASEDPSSTSVGPPTGIGGPTGVGGPSALSAVLDQLDQLPGNQPGLRGHGQHGGDAGLEVETHLPPPAPGLLAPGQFIDVPTGVYDQDGPDRDEPPTRRAIVVRGAAAGPGSGPASRASPLRPPPAAPVTGAGGAAAVGDGDDDQTGAFTPSELTTPMGRLDDSGLGLPAVPPSRSSPHSIIPALPPPPGPPAALTSGENTALTALPQAASARRLPSRPPGESGPVSARREDSFTPLTPHERPARGGAFLAGAPPRSTAPMPAVGVAAAPSFQSPLRPALHPATPPVARMAGGDVRASGGGTAPVLRSSGGTGSIALQRSAGGPTTGAFSGPLSITAARPAPTLPPIPAAAASVGVADSLRYLGVVARGVLARRREKQRVRERLVGMQRSLDGLLQQLGRAAFEERLQTPALADEMRLSAQAEERRLRALQHCDQQNERRASETQRDRAAEAEQREAIARLSQEAEHLSNDLQQRAGRRRELLAEVARIDGALRRLARTAEAATARARAQADSAEAASAAAAQATSARGQAEALVPQREQVVAQAEALEGPIAALTQQLGEVRSELSLRQTELSRLQADHRQRLQQIEDDLALSRAESQAAERELQQRMMTIGTLVNLTRPAGARYQPLYQQVDELKAGLTDGEAVLARLATESAHYDQQAVQRGLLYLGGGVLLIGLVLALLYVLLALRGQAPAAATREARAAATASRDEPAAAIRRDAPPGPAAPDDRGAAHLATRGEAPAAEAAPRAGPRPLRYPRARNLASTRFNSADQSSR